MFNLLYMLSRIVVVPYDLITSPFRASNSRDSGRSRALMLGLPAVLVAALGVGLLSWAEFGKKDNLIENYDSMAEQTREKKNQLAAELKTETALRSSQPQSSKNMATIEEDPRVKELRSLNEEERIYLEKLIWLNPDEADYRYRLAFVAASNGDGQRLVSLMNSIAPDEEPGYAKAHLWMARFYIGQAKKNPSMSRKLYQKALKQTEHCLVRENGNREARILKAELLKNDKRLIEAYNVYEEIFEEDPRYYMHLVAINNLLGGDNSKKNPIIMDQAQLRFKEAVDEAAINYDESWAGAWINLCGCLVQAREYETAAKFLNREEVVQKNLSDSERTPEAAARHIHIKILLTELYASWASTINPNQSVENATLQLELLKKALVFNKDNLTALQLIARIAIGDSALASEAKQIYDPEKDDNASAGVLDELGGHALAVKDYEKAIKYFELARRKAPNNPKILNNLAYAYLICENKNPDRALTLVNQALQIIVRRPDSNEKRTFASHFLDTKGRALMQMDRMDEAAAALELAMQKRTPNEEILAALILCYEGRDNLQAEVYRKRLEELKAKKTTDGQAGG